MNKPEPPRPIVWRRRARRRRVRPLSEASPADIAIVGLSCRFPGASNTEEFWRNLHDGVESISFYSPEDLAASGIDPAVLANPHFVPAGSLTEGAELFDASFFGINPREAESMDPQQRVFLECAWHALENAGYHPERYRGSIGVYAGCAMSTYFHQLLRNPGFLHLVGHLQALIGNDKDYLSTHVSYKLNLRGPSISIQSTCATSLVAICVACESIRSGSCDMALAGGVCIRAPQITGYYHEPGGIYSPDGHCRVFDSDAQGVVFGNGVGVVVLKRLVDALADGDLVHAVIKGWAINNDGASKTSYTAPSIDGQADVIARAQAMAGVNPGTVTYIEAHGTATAAGDPVEIAALSKAFRRGTKKKGFCAVGSVKSNFGHLDHAAGVAGLIKTVLALKHRQIPPTLNFEQPHPAIPFADSPFYVNQTLSDWKCRRFPRRAGVSAFGIGGTNAHVMLEEAPRRQSLASSRPAHLLLISARTSTALETATSRLIEHLKAHPHLAIADVAYTLQVGRRCRPRARIGGRDARSQLQVARSEAPGGVYVFWAGLAICEHGARVIPFRTALQKAGRSLRGALEAADGTRSARDDLPAGGAVAGNRGPTDTDRARATRALCHRICAGAPVDGMGRAPVGDDRPQHRRICRRVPRGSIHAQGRTGACRGARPPDAAVADGIDARGIFVRAGAAALSK